MIFYSSNDKKSCLPIFYSRAIDSPERSNFPLNSISTKKTLKPGKRTTYPLGFGTSSEKRDMKPDTLSSEIGSLILWETSSGNREFGNRFLTTSRYISANLSGRGERYYKKETLQTLYDQKGHRLWNTGNEK